MILVLNAGGNIGKEVVRELQERGAAFTAAYRSSQQVAEAQQAGLKAVAADFSRPETLDAALSGADRVFVVTPPLPNMEEMESNVVAAAQKAGVRQLVKLSVWGAESGAFLFGRLHRAVEKKIIAAGIPYTLLRPTGFMQNMLSSAPTIQAQGAFFLPAGEARVSEIDYRDIAKVASVALTEEGHLGKAYDLTGPEAMTNAERAQVLSEVLGRPIAYISPPDADWKATMLGYGMPEWQADGILDLQRYYKAGNSERVSPAVEEVTGSRPISYRRFVEEHREAFLSPSQS
jgi:uncharacterized protein YbjT (DUF2867 family)